MPTRSISERTMRTIEIPPLCHLGTLPKLSDWKIACRCWFTSGVRHYQFVARHSNGWLFEYRCLETGKYLDSYWCSAPASKILTEAVEDFTSLFAQDELQTLEEH